MPLIDREELHNLPTAVSIVLISAILLIFLSLPAAAQSCSFSNTGLNFGTVDLSDNNRVRTSGSFTATCSGTPKATIRVCANFGSGTAGTSAAGDPRFMNSGVNSLNYNIFKNANYSNVWGSSLWPYSPGPRSFKLRLNKIGTKSVSIPIRGQIYSNQANTTPGLYSSSFSGSHTLISYAYSNLGNCNVISANGGVRVPFNVSANVVGGCTLATTNMNFGTVGVLTANLDTSNTISVSCSNLTPYTIGLSGGQSGTTDPTLRKMANGLSEVTYGIYQDSARTIPWGDTIGSNTISNIGNGSVQNFAAYGRVTVQNTPAAGIYSDTIIVTMTY